jgi:TPR repeat protein
MTVRLGAGVACLCVLLSALFSPDWLSFAAELRPVLSAHADQPAARDAVRRAVWDGHSERGYHVTRQARDLGYEVADSNHKIVRWRLLVPAVARGLRLPDWATLGLAHLGCLALVGALAVLGRRLAPAASGPAVLGFCVTAGATAPFFTSMGWLGYYDSLLALGLLAVAFAPGRALVLAACLLTPWVDERFILGLPLALLVRLLCAPEPDLRAWLRREALAPLALAGAYALLRLALGGSGGSQTVSQYLGQFVFGYPLDGLQRLAGAWAGLRLGWILALTALTAAFLPAAGLRPRLGPALLATSLLTALLALHTALDLSRSTVLLLPLLPLGWLAATRLLPPHRLTLLSLALAALALALPAHHVFGKASLPVEDCFGPSLPLMTAQNNLGLFHGEGRIHGVDHPAALHWFRRAAENGFPVAWKNLGVMYSTGSGVVRDPAQAAELYRRAALLGLAEAQNNLGAMYYSGTGVPRDLAQAASWIGRAAEQGYTEAQKNLGLMLARGEGVEPDPVAAARWLRRAAEAGHVEARRCLGLMHLSGLGVAADPAAALRWFSLAAGQGDAEAAFQAGRLLVQGDGVPREVIAGHHWLSVARIRGHPDAGPAIAATEAAMSPAELAAARAAASGLTDSPRP